MKIHRTGQREGIKTMNIRNKNLPRTRLTILALAISTQIGVVEAQTAPSPLPTRPSEKSVAVIPQVDTLQIVGPVASCGDGFTTTQFSRGDCIDIEQLGLNIKNGIRCDFVSSNDGPSINWFPDSSRDNIPPTVDFVIVEGGCVDQDYGGACNLDLTINPRTVADLFVYGNFGESLGDTGLTVCDAGEGGNCNPVLPEFVTVCSGQADNQTVETSEIPVCTDPGLCPPAAPGDQSVTLVEIVRVRDANGDLLQPEERTGDTCACTSTPGGSLTQCDPSVADGPTSCSNQGTGDVPNQVTRVDQNKADPYFCTTLNGQRRCWAY